MRREFMVPFAWAVTLGGMICISADKSSGNRKPEAKPATVAINNSSRDPRTVEVGVGDSDVWTNQAGTPYAAKPDDDAQSLKAGEFKYHRKVHDQVMGGTIVVKAAAKK